MSLRPRALSISRTSSSRNSAVPLMSPMYTIVSSVTFFLWLAIGLPFREDGSPRLLVSRIGGVRVLAILIVGAPAESHLRVDIAGGEVFEDVHRSEEHTSELQSPCNLV